MTAGIDGMMAHSAVRGGEVAGERRRKAHRRLILPLCLATGWGILIGYSTVLLTHEAPLRPDGAQQASLDEPGPFEVPRELSRAKAVLPWAEPAPVPNAPPRDAALHNAPSQDSLLQDAPGSASPTRGDGTAAVQQGPATEHATASHGTETGAPAITPPPIERAAYVGLWGPTPAACGRGARRKGFIPARITESGAKAGGTSCSFRDGRKVGAGWTLAASCNDGGRRWSSQVRLLVDGDRLIWSSAKGDASYIRCGRRTG